MGQELPHALRQNQPFRRRTTVKAVTDLLNGQ